MKLLISIGGKLDKSLMSAIGGAQSQLSGLAKTIRQVGDIGLKAMGGFTAAAVAGLTSCTREAAQFANGMAPVTKYVEGLADATGKIDTQKYEEASKIIRDMSTQIPMTQGEIQKVTAALGQANKSYSELFQVDKSGRVSGLVKDAAVVATAWDIAAQTAGDYMGKWETSMNMSHAEVMDLMDQINYLGGHSATTAAEIADAVNSAASLGQIGGIDPATTAALADAMLATGVATDRVGTSIKRMVTNFSKGGTATKAQQEMWMELGFTANGVAKSMQEDSVKTLDAIFTAVGSLPEERQVAALSTLFGQWAIEGGAKIVGNLDAYRDALAMVNDPGLYQGSMTREFTIMADTPEAVSKMLGSSAAALKGEIGDSFLPVQKEFGKMMIGVINDLREYMPQISQIADNLASALGGGVARLGEVFQQGRPYIQALLDYLIQNGPQAVKILGGMAGAFAAMKYAPGLLGGAGNLLLGAKSGAGNYAARTGGLSGMLSGLWKGGRNVQGRIGTAAGYVKDAAGMAQASGIPGWQGGITGFLGALKNTPGLMSGGKKSGKAIEDMNNLIQAVSTNGGIFGAIKNSIATSGAGKYFGGTGSSMGNFLSQSGIAGVVRGTAGVSKEILSGIAQATGLTDLVNGGIGLARTGAGRAAGGVTTLASNVMNSTPVQTISGIAGRAVNSAPAQGIASIAGGAAGWLGNAIPAGAGILGNLWGPMASGFGGLLSGSLPIVGVISSAIAAVSILGDHLEDIRGIVGTVFGDAGLAAFDTFIGGLQRVSDFITGLFQDGGVAQAMAPLRDAITGMFGDDAGAAFDGLVQILQSVMGVVGQVVTFANTTVKPILQDIFGFITTTAVPIIVQTFTAAAPVISGIISSLGTAVMTVAQIIGTAVQTALPIVENIISVIMSIASVVVPAVLAGIEVLSAGIAPIIQGVQTAFQGIINFITGVFTGDWSLAWQGVQDIFKGAFEALAGLIKTPVNAVIALINKAISGINGLGLDIPDWVPLIGGKKFSINIPEIPMLAKGGFTSGPSIAGEAGTEAVISFQKSERARNIDTWLRAGELLGMANPAGKLAGMGNQTVELLDFQGRPGRDSGLSINFAPQIIIQGSADRGTMDQALMESEQRFQSWIEANFERLFNRVERERGRKAYA